MIKTKKVKKQRKNINKLTKKKNKIKSIVVKYKLPDNEIDKQEGIFYDVNYYDKILDENCDVYGINENGEKILLIKLRKNVIPNEICINAYKALESKAQQKNVNRGAAAGKLDLKTLPSYAKNTVEAGKYSVSFKIGSKSGSKSKGRLSNPVRSNVIGYYDVPDRNMVAKLGPGRTPHCRETQFMRDQVEKWQNVIPIVEEADKQFKTLVPMRHKIQLKQANKTANFRIGKTAYSTVTVNYNYRSACHKDVGDLDEGFGNLIVLEKNKCLKDGEGIHSNRSDKYYDFIGGYLGFPKYGIAVNPRQGDFLAMNVHEWHCNCKLGCSCPKGKKCKNEKHYGRMSLVCYLRKNMVLCNNKGFLK
jgi:hypothetical protein